MAKALLVDASICAIGLLESGIRARERAGALVVTSEESAVEVDVPEGVVDFFESDVLALERIADEDLARVDAEAAGVGDAPNLEVPGVLRRGALAPKRWTPPLRSQPVQVEASLGS